MMKNQVLKAISNTLNNLVIDDDSSISYHKSEADNEYEFYPTLHELQKMLDEHPIDIFKFNTTKALTVIMDDGTEIGLRELRKDPKYWCNMEHAMFIKLITPELSAGNNEIIINLQDNFKIKTNIRWQVPEKLLAPNHREYDKIARDIAISFAESDLCGYKNCQQYIKVMNDNPEITMDALSYCNDLILNVGADTYHGYVPSAGQLKILANYIQLFNVVSKYIMSNPLDLNDSLFWSSTEYNPDSEFIIYGQKTVLTEKHYHAGMSALPFFKKIKG